jgi:hypothetical protein
MYDAYGQALMTQKTSIFDLKSVFGLCGLRDKPTLTGTATISNSSEKFDLSVLAAGDVASLSTRECGVYVSGMACEIGMGLQVATALTGDQTVRFGYFDDQNGYFYLIQAGQLSCCVRQSGVDLIFPMSQWNGDWANHAEVDVLAGKVWQITFSYYGYGPVQFSVMYTSDRGTPTTRILHTYGPVGRCSTNNPHLPVQVEVKANTCNTPLSVYVTSRQFSVLGAYDPPHRISSFTYTQTGIGTTWTPGFSLERKPDRAGAHITICGFDAFTTAPVMMLFKTGSVLTNANFQNTFVQDYCIDGAGLLMDVASTTMDAGYILYTMILPLGYISVTFETSNERILIDDRPFSVSFKSLQATADVTAFVLRVKEAH